MTDGGELMLEGQAVEEILRDAKRSKELVNDFGLYRGRRRDALPNKRFLNNTLVSTLRHSYRTEKKHRDGSDRKFQQHMNTRRRIGRNYYRNQGDRKEIVEPDNDGPEPDYGEFDAIAYSEKCTDLYIRDSHRKHFFMRGNFVEKHHKGSSSESEESYTEYDDPPEKQKQDRFEGKWSDTGSADDYASGLEEISGTIENEDNQDRDRHNKSSRHRDKYLDQKVVQSGSRSGKELVGRKRKDLYSQEAGTSKDDFGGEVYSDEITYSPKRKKLKKDREDLSETDEDSDREFVNSGTESADNMDMPKKNKGKGKRPRKLPADGKELWEKISSRSMYADIEEMKWSKNDHVEHDLHRKGERKYPQKIKQEKDERRQKYLKQKLEDERKEEEMRRIADRKRKEEEMKDEAERERKEDSMRRLAERKRKEEDRFEAEKEDEHTRRVSDMHWKEEQMRRAAFKHFRGFPQRRPFRGRPFMRPGPFFRGRPPRGFRGGFPMFPPVNPFYASLFYEMDPYLLEKFIKEHGHKLLRKNRRHGDKSESRSRSRSRSHSRSRSRRYKKKKRRYYSDSDSSYSRDRSRSRSRRRSSRRSSSYSRSHSRDRKRSHSRDRKRSHSRDRKRSHSRSRRRSSSSDYHSSSRSRSRSKQRKRSYSYESSKHSGNEDSHRSHSRSSRKHKRHKGKKSKHRKHSKSKHRSRKSSESEAEEEKSSDNRNQDSDKDTDNENSDSESEESVGVEVEYLENAEVQQEVSEGEIVSDSNDGLESVSEESGEAWSSSEKEEGLLESD